jgi:phosphoglycolate phosphatase-like HAD superfamily hydrolase
MRIQYIVFDFDGTLMCPRTLSIYPGVTSMLAQLGHRGIACYIWTGRERHSVEDILTDNALMGYFVAMSCGDDALPKPQLASLTNLLPNVDAKSVLVLGDSVHDLMGARAFGAHFCAATWSNPALRVMFEQAGAQTIFDKIESFKQYLEEVIHV